MLISSLTSGMYLVRPKSDRFSVADTSPPQTVFLCRSEQALVLVRFDGNANADLVADVGNVLGQAEIGPLQRGGHIAAANGLLMQIGTGPSPCSLRREREC